MSGVNLNTGQNRHCMESGIPCSGQIACTGEPFHDNAGTRLVCRTPCLKPDTGTSLLYCMTIRLLHKFLHLFQTRRYRTSTKYTENNHVVRKNGKIHRIAKTQIIRQTVLAEKCGKTGTKNFWNNGRQAAQITGKPVFKSWTPHEIDFCNSRSTSLSCPWGRSNRHPDCFSGLWKRQLSEKQWLMLPNEHRFLSHASCFFRRIFHWILHKNMNLIFIFLEDFTFWTADTIRFVELVLCN